jgi:hypothetical protein
MLVTNGVVALFAWRVGKGGFGFFVLGFLRERFLAALVLLVIAFG